MKKQRIEELKVECIRELLDVPNYSHCKLLVRNDEKLWNHGDYRLGRHEKLTYKSYAFDLTVFYKYMNFKSFLLFLQRGFYFVEPCRWPDKYESKFYRRSEGGVIDKYPDANYEDAPYLYACCMSASKETESAWKMYRGDKLLEQKCVKLIINRNAFFDLLNTYATFNDSQVYCGAVTYAYRDYEIDSFYSGEKNRYIWFGDFSLLNYLSLLLVKRPAFMTEDEIRFFIVPNNNKMGDEGRINVGYSTTMNSIIKGVILDPWCNEDDVKYINFICESNGLTCTVDKSHLFDDINTSESVFSINNIKNPWDI